jgi:hypothetical protein
MIDLKKHGKEEFEFIRLKTYDFLSRLDSSQGDTFVESVSKALPSQDVIDKQSEDIVRWFSEGGLASIQLCPHVFGQTLPSQHVDVGDDVCTGQHV